LLIVEEPPLRAEDLAGDADQRRVVDQGVGARGGPGGKAHVVGEPPALDGGAGIVEDGTGVAGVEAALGHPGLGLGQVGLGPGQTRLVEGPPERGITVGVEKASSGPSSR
jgi:hypothetical protein